VQGTAMTLTARFDELLNALVVACQRDYGQRLVSLAVFGSVGRGTPRPDSDLDLLIVAEDLPRGRVARVGDFARVEADMADALRRLRSAGVTTELSPVLKTPSEVEQGSPLFLDMLEDARILVDRGGFLMQAFERLRARLTQLGARRIWRGNAWFWDLKPDYRPGEVFEL
jgi:predicted nucleotidyltransferase